MFVRDSCSYSYFFFATIQQHNMAPVQSRLLQQLTLKDLEDKYMEQKSDTKYVCKLCNPDWTPDSTYPVKTLTKGKGYSWVSQHSRLKHVYKNLSQRNLELHLMAGQSMDYIIWLFLRSVAEYPTMASSFLDFLLLNRSMIFPRPNT